jgi:hypothetical protein
MSTLAQKVAQELIRAGVSPYLPDLASRHLRGSHGNASTHPFASLLVLSTVWDYLFPWYLGTLGKHAAARYLRSSAFSVYDLVKEPFEGKLDATDVYFDLSFESSTPSTIVENYRFYETTPPDHVIADIEAPVKDPKKAAAYSRITSFRNPIAGAHEILEYIIFAMSELPTEVVNGRRVHVFKPEYLTTGNTALRAAVRRLEGYATADIQCIAQLIEKGSPDRDKYGMQVSLLILYLCGLEGAVFPEGYYEAIAYVYNNATSLADATKRIQEIDAFYNKSTHAADTITSPFLARLSDELLPGIDLYGAKTTPEAIESQIAIVIDALLPVFIEALDSVDAYDRRKVEAAIRTIEVVRDTEGAKGAHAFYAAETLRAAILSLLATDFPVDRVYGPLADAVLDACDV